MAKEKGLEKGCAEIEEKFIPKLLKTHTPEEISEEFDVSIERVLEIRNGNG